MNLRELDDGFKIIILFEVILISTCIAVLVVVTQHISTMIFVPPIIAIPTAVTYYLLLPDGRIK